MSVSKNRQGGTFRVLNDVFLWICYESLVERDPLSIEKERTAKGELT